MVSLLVLAHRGILRWLQLTPPREAALALAQHAKPALVVAGEAPGRRQVGRSFSHRARGVWEYHLFGDALDLGYAHASLALPLLEETERYMFAEFRHFVPSALARAALKTAVLFKYRHLLDGVSADLRTEMTALAGSQPDPFGDFLPIYHRIQFYHALHDITQSLEHSPFLGCTGFAAGSTATPTGHLILGRNFDFEGPPIFDRDKAVLFFHPQGKLAFASVGWAGMVGVVTGINAMGVYVSVNAMRTTDNQVSGVPVSLLIRQVMETAKTLDEAIEILRSQPVMVPDLYLLGDGKSAEAAVVERSPTRFVVKRSRGTLPVANHSESPEFAGDPENSRLRDELTSGARLTRLREVLAERTGAIDAPGALAILRDKRGPGGIELGLGNRSALDALIATHSVVVDATEMILWVSRGPHALGSYVGFDLRAALRGEDRPVPPDLPTDPVLDSPAHRAYIDAEQALAESRAQQTASQPVRAVETARQAVAHAPRHVDARKHLADLLWPVAPQEAAAQYQVFLTLSPPYRKDIRQAEERVRAAGLSRARTGQ